MGVKVTADKTKIAMRIKAGSELATIAVTEAIVEYGYFCARRSRHSYE